jgi:hypothetical protein
MSREKLFLATRVDLDCRTCRIYIYRFLHLLHSNSTAICMAISWRTFPRGCLTISTSFHFCMLHPALSFYASSAISFNPAIEFRSLRYWYRSGVTRSQDCIQQPYEFIAVHFQRRDVPVCRPSLRFHSDDHEQLWWNRDDMSRYEIIRKHCFELTCFSFSVLRCLRTQRSLHCDWRSFVFHVKLQLFAWVFFLNDYLTLRRLVLRYQHYGSEQ